MSRRKPVMHTLVVGAVVAGVMMLDVPSAVGNPPPRLAQKAPAGPVAGRSGGGKPEPVAPAGLLFPTERTTTRKLAQARSLIADGRYGEAVVFLDKVLGSTEDWFLRRSSDARGPVSLKAEAMRLLGSLPEKGRAIYELQFGARARKLLETAAATGDLAGVDSVARRYFFTKAGRQATLLVGRAHLDRDRPLAAARCFEQLVHCPAVAGELEPTLSVLAAYSWHRAGHDGRARRTLLDLKSRYPNAVLRGGGRQWTLPNDAAGAVGWLEDVVGSPAAAKIIRSADWLTFRGDPARNADSAGGRPLLTPRWRVRMANYPTVERVLKQMQQAFATRGVVALPGLHPLAIGDLIVMRTARDVVAVDCRTGKRVWESSHPGDGLLDQLSEVTQTTRQTASLFQLGLGLQHRMWDDTAYGTLSSDGHLVFVVDGLELVSGAPRGQSLILRIQRAAGARGRLTGTTGARLRALELEHGRTVWQVGGADGAEPALADAFFLGAPLVQDGQLLSLVEVKGGVRLVVLDAETGKLQWAQQLVDLEQDIQQDPLRRLAGAIPSAADGMVVCPTSAGAVVAVDLTRRILAWGFQYPQKNRHRRGWAMGGMQGRAGSRFQTSDRWVDPTITLVNGRALVTPVDGNALYCLRLTDGKLLWQQPRDDHLFIACVHRDNVVLVGAGGMTAVRLADGSPGWHPSVSLSPGSRPSGRGYRCGDLYYLPLSSAQVITVDLQAGRIVARARSRDGHIPGNLICHRDQVISQGVDYLETYYQIEPLQARVRAVLARNPNDPEALARSGELALEAGRRSEAVAQFQASFAADPNPLTRDLLVQSLLETLRLDFPTGRAAIAQLQRLIDQPRQRAEFLCLVARGYQAAGDPMAALDALLKLADMPGKTLAPLNISPRLTVRRDRWVRAHLAAVRAAATAADRAHLDARIKARVDALLQPAVTVDAMRRFVATFGGHPAADTVRLALARKLLAKRGWLECEVNLRAVERANQGPTQRAAVALMAQLLHQAGRPAEAARYYARLAGPLRDVPCLDGKTGAELFAALPAKDAVHKQLAGTPAWPHGRVTVKTGRAVRSASTFRRTALPIDGRRRPFFSRLALSFDQNTTRTIVGRDGFGIERFRIPLTPPAATRGPVLAIPHYSYGRVRDHLLLISMGRQILAVDTLAGAKPVWRNVLWRRELTTRVPGLPQYQEIRLKRTVNPAQPQRYHATDRQGRVIGLLGPPLAAGITFQEGSDLICADALTGVPQWVRHSVPAGSQLFGDESLLLVVPPAGSTAQPATPELTAAETNGPGNAAADERPNGKEKTATAIGLSPWDGTILGTRPVPRLSPTRQRITTRGRQVLDWIRHPDGIDLVLFDVWGRKTVWSRHFARGSKAWLVEHSAMAVLEPAGHFAVLSLDDGQPQFTAQIDPVPDLVAIYMLASRDQLLLVVSTPIDGRQRRSVSPLVGTLNRTIVSGRVYAFDRHTGKLQWPAPARIHNRGLWLAQPADLPVLVFVQQVSRLDRTGHRRRAWLSVLCLDRRSGRLVYKADDLPPTASVFNLVGAPAAARVTLTEANRQVTMTFTDQPAVTERPYQESAKTRPEPGPAKGTGLLDILGVIPRAIAEAAGGLNADQGMPAGTARPKRKNLPTGPKHHDSKQAPIPLK